MMRQIFDVTFRHESTTIVITADGPRVLAAGERTEIIDTARFVMGRMLLIGRPQPIHDVIGTLRRVLDGDARLHNIRVISVAT